MAKVIFIVNQKEGVGKATSTVNLASYMSEQGAKVLFDLDVQFNASSGISIRSDAAVYSFYDWILSEDVTNFMLFPILFDHLHLIPASEQLSEINSELSDRKSREKVLKSRLALVKNFYNYSVFDTPFSLDLLTINALVSLDKFVIFIQYEYFALVGVDEFVQAMEEMKTHLNVDLEIIGIVLTMYDKRALLNRQVLENVRFFKELVVDTVIPKSIWLTEAPSHGLPIALYDSYSKGEIAYCPLAKEILSRV